MKQFIVRGFAGSRHPRRVPFGTLLLETMHSSESSAAVEVGAWQERMRRHEVSHCELIDCRSEGSLTNLSIYQYTNIKWSWKKGE